MDAHRQFQRWIRQIGPVEAFTGLVALLESLDEDGAAVFAVDAGRNIQFWSEGAQRLLGFPAEDVVGQHCLKSNRCENCMAGCGITTHGQISDVPLKYFDSHGNEVLIEKSGRAFFDAAGDFAGGIEILRPRREGRKAKGERLPRPSQRDDLLAGFEVEQFHGLVTGNPEMRRVFALIRNVAETQATVLVRGESGTGKELVARALHEESQRRNKPFLAVNCAALSENLLESELFGHVKGAFTGAVANRKGLFEQADGGTLFLDEVAELHLDLQAKLLRVLQEQVFSPVGSTRTVKVDVRIISATHQPLRLRAAEGTFREDLMYRLRVVPLYIPALRERRLDVEILLRHFVQRNNERGPRMVRDIHPDALRVLLDHRWPGNVREVINVVQYAFAVGRAPTLGLSDLPPEFREADSSLRVPMPGVMQHSPEQSEKREMELALSQTGGHIGQAAERLGMSRPTFWRKRKKYGF